MIEVKAINVLKNGIWQPLSQVAANGQFSESYAICKDGQWYKVANLTETLFSIDFLALARYGASYQEVNDAPDVNTLENSWNHLGLTQDWTNCRIYAHADVSNLNNVVAADLVLSSNLSGVNLDVVAVSSSHTTLNTSAWLAIQKNQVLSDTAPWPNSGAVLSLNQSAIDTINSNNSLSLAIIDTTDQQEGNFRNDIATPAITELKLKVYQ